MIIAIIQYIVLVLIGSAVGTTLGHLIWKWLDR